MPALIGTHVIRYRDLQGTRPGAPAAIPAALEFSDRSYTHQKRFGTDKWVLAVGETLDQLLRDATSKSTPKSGHRLVVHGLEVTEFKKGLFQWSRHSIRIQFRYELWRDKERLKSGVIQAWGEGTGAEFGFLTFVPILGNLNFDKGIELALSRCLQKAVASLAGEVSG
jgi:hypothetical protein